MKAVVEMYSGGEDDDDDDSGVIMGWSRSLEESCGGIMPAAGRLFK
jgi:hypothetical protein